MKYKGYTAKVEFDEIDRIFVGRVVGIRDVIGFHGATVEELENAFKAAVDNYLSACKKLDEMKVQEVDEKFDSGEDVLDYFDLTKGRRVNQDLSEKQLVKGLTPHMAHADELAKLTSHEIDGITLSPEKKEKLRELAEQDLTPDEKVKAVIKLFGGDKETASIMLDPEMLAQLKSSVADLKDKRLIPLEEAFKDLLEDIELKAIVEARKDQPEIEYELGELLEGCSPESMQQVQEDKDWLDEKPVGKEVVDDKKWLSFANNLGKASQDFMIDREVDLLISNPELIAELKADVVYDLSKKELMRLVSKKLKEAIKDSHETTEKLKKCLEMLQAEKKW